MDPLQNICKNEHYYIELDVAVICDVRVGLLRARGTSCGTFLLNIRPFYAILASRRSSARGTALQKRPLLSAKTC